MPISPDDFDSSEPILTIAPSTEQASRVSDPDLAMASYRRYGPAKLSRYGLSLLAISTALLVGAVAIWPFGWGGNTRPTATPHLYFVDSSLCPSLVLAHPCVNSIALLPNRQAVVYLTFSDPSRLLPRSIEVSYVITDLTGQVLLRSHTSCPLTTRKGVLHAVYPLTLPRSTAPGVYILTSDAELSGASSIRLKVY